MLPSWEKAYFPGISQIVDLSALEYQEQLPTNVRAEKPVSTVNIPKGPFEIRQYLLVCNRIS